VLSANERQSRGNCRIPTDRVSRNWTIAVLILAVILPGVISFGVLSRQALTVPYQDDYKAILDFGLRYEHLPSSETKVIAIATEQFNEYKLGFEHAVVATELELTHHLNFTFLTVIGNLFLLPIAYLLWLTYERDQSDLLCRLLEFLPISLLIFSLTYWETLNWAMTGLQNVPVVCFSLLAIYTLVPDAKSGGGNVRFLVACIAAALAAWSSANGFLLAPIGLVILLRQRAYGRSLLWSMSFAVPLATYLYHYVSSVHVLHKAFYLTRPLFFLAFLGCAVPFKWVSALVGTAVLFVIILAIRSRFDLVNPVAVYFAVWLVGTGCLVAWVRGGSGFSIASRYSMYSILLLIFCYRFLVQYLANRVPNLDRTRLYLASAVVAGCIFMMADRSANRHLEARRRMVLSGIEFYRSNPEINSPMVDPLVESLFPEEKMTEHATLNRAINDGIYTLCPKRETGQR
jgi:hypothetical protein